MHQSHGVGLDAEDEYVVLGEDAVKSTKNDTRPPFQYSIQGIMNNFFWSHCKSCYKTLLLRFPDVDNMMGGVNLTVVPFAASGIKKGKIPVAVNVKKV